MRDPRSRDEHRQPTRKPAPGSTGRRRSPLKYTALRVIAAAGYPHRDPRTNLAPLCARCWNARRTPDFAPRPEVRAGQASRALDRRRSPFKRTAFFVGGARLSTPCTARPAAGALSPVKCTACQVVARPGYPQPARTRMSRRRYGRAKRSAPLRARANRLAFARPELQYVHRSRFDDPDCPRSTTGAPRSPKRAPCCSMRAAQHARKQREVSLMPRAHHSISQRFE